MAGATDGAATQAGTEARRLYVYNGGFLTQQRIRRILGHCGYRIHIGAPHRDTDAIGVWGKSPTAPRGEGVAEITGRPVVRVEDAFLRSIRPGRLGEPPLGLMVDETGGVHFDSGQPSALERLLATHPLDDTALLDRARTGIDRLRQAGLSKYNDFDPALAPPPPGYVLVIDQTRDDASVRYGAATAATFREMLVFAQEEHPGARVIIRPHPETVLGLRPGHYGDGHAHGHVSLLRDPVSPWQLLDGAIAVYTVSSQMGFEAILAGHKPRVFGQPFYGGWGLTADENPVARRERRLTRPQLFAAAMILAPRWYDPCRDRLVEFEEAVDHLEAQLRAHREDRDGYVATGMRLWKRRHLQQFFGRPHALRFSADTGAAAARARASGRSLLVWAGAEDATLRAAGDDIRLRRVEDGFIRSRGLGAALVPPLSLVTDGRGIYYDPGRPSDLEDLIAAPVPPGGIARAERLIARLVRSGLSKYNLDAAAPPEMPRPRP